MALDQNDIAAIAAEVVRLLDADGKSAKVFNSAVPLDLREAAEVCHVELVWLRERVARKDIPAYRNREGTPWRVFPKDIRAYLMENSNQRPARRKSVLRLTRSA